MIGKPVKCYVVHRFYGCESGCEGHVVLIEDARGESEETGKFHFMWPDGGQEKWARDLAASEAPGVPFSWPDCAIAPAWKPLTRKDGL